MDERLESADMAFFGTQTQEMEAAEDSVIPGPGRGEIHSRFDPMTIPEGRCGRSRRVRCGCPCTLRQGPGKRNRNCPVGTCRKNEGFSPAAPLDENAADFRRDRIPSVGRGPDTSVLRDDGLHGYIGFSHEPAPANGGYNAGMGFYAVSGR